MIAWLPGATRWKFRRKGLRCAVWRASLETRAPFFSSSFENPHSCSLGLAFLLLGDVVSCRMEFEGRSEVGGLRASLGMP